jgi:hypothetical protein
MFHPLKSSGDNRTSLKRILLVALAAGATALTVSACSSSAATPTSSGTDASSSASDGTSAAQPVRVPLTLQIDADKGPKGTFTGKEHWPRLALGDGTAVPADYQAAIDLPAHTTVTLVISNYDDAVTKLPSSSPYFKPTGGTETVNGQPVTELTNKNIAHTITLADLGINIPIPIADESGPAVVEFTFTTGDAGTYQWRCMTPCGGGSKGMDGSMATDGWMRGSFVVA